jgi:hypothetical protein
MTVSINTIAIKALGYIQNEGLGLEDAITKAAGGAHFEYDQYLQIVQAVDELGTEPAGPQVEIEAYPDDEPKVESVPEPKEEPKSKRKKHLNDELFEQEHDFDE